MSRRDWSYFSALGNAELVGRGKQFSLKLDADRAARLTALAFARRIGVAELVRQLIDAAIGENSQCAARSAER